MIVGQPFLQDNARLSMGFSALLPELAPYTADEYIVGIPGGDTLLNRLRLSLVEDRPIENPVYDDGSLTIHNVSGPRREVEVLKDRILEALRDDTSLAPTQSGYWHRTSAAMPRTLKSCFRNLMIPGRPFPGTLSSTSPIFLPEPRHPIRPPWPSSLSFRDPASAATPC